MELTLDSSKGNYQIRSYEPGKIVINDQIYTRSLILSAAKLLNWKPQNINELTSDDFAAVIALKPQIVILGTGAQQIFPSSQQLHLLAENNLGIEIMSTSAACRTFNVLIAEDRNVVAALIL